MSVYELTDLLTAVNVLPSFYFFSRNPKGCRNRGQLAPAPFTKSEEGAKVIFQLKVGSENNELPISTIRS